MPYYFGGKIPKFGCQNKIETQNIYYARFQCSLKFDMAPCAVLLLYSVQQSPQNVGQYIPQCIVADWSTINIVMKQFRPLYFFEY